MKLGKASLLGLSLLTALGTASCSGFFDDDESEPFELSTAYQYLDSDGDIYFTMVFSDGSEVTVTIPAGTSIDSVNYVLSDDGTYYTLTISYTGDYPNTVLTIPVPQDGKGITNMEVDPNEEDRTTTVTFTFSDGTSSSFTIPWGENGISVTEVSSSIDEDTGDTIITFCLSNGDTYTATVKKGDPGNGIDHIEVSALTESVDENGNAVYEFTMTIVYEGGTNTPCTIQIPKPSDGTDGEDGARGTIWYSSYGDPSSQSSMLEDAQEGDYYLNLQNGKVYQYKSGDWAIIFIFSGTGSSTETTQCAITFIGGSNASLIYRGNQLQNDYCTDQFDVGSYLSESDFPTATKDGYDFIGWFTSETYNINSGQFTTLTAVPNLTSLSLYAWWAESSAE